MTSYDIRDLRALADSLEASGIDAARVSLIRTAATDLENANAWEDANLPSVGTRLMAYRQGLLASGSYGTTFANVERDAHAMLKAERAPVGK